MQWGSNWNSKETIEQFKKNNDTAKVSPILGFVFDPEPVKAELAKIESITKDTDQVLFAGAEPDYDKYITELKDKMMAAGAQKVIDEISRQLADWKQANGK